MSTPEEYANRHFELERVAAALALAEEHVRRLRAVLGSGLADSVARMLADDLNSATARVQWLREHPSIAGERASKGAA